MLNKFLIFLIVISVGVLGGGWIYVHSIKIDVKPSFSEQTELFKTLGSKQEALITLYQTDIPTNLQEQDTPAEVNVLGAKTSKDDKDKVVDQVGSVLGIEDSYQMQRTRDIMEMLSRYQETVERISERNQEIKKLSSYQFLNKYLKISPPISDTDRFVSEVSPVIRILQSEAALSVKALSYGFDLGSSFQLALARVDELSINQLESKIADLKLLSEEEEKIVAQPMPPELKAVLDQSVKSGQKVVAYFEEIPDLLRKKDGVGIQKTVTLMTLHSSSDSIRQKTNLLTFLKNYQTLRNSNLLAERWSKATMGL